MNLIKKAIGSFLESRGYRLSKIYGPDMPPDFIRIQKQIGAFTMTSIERQFALFNAVRYLVEHDIPGDIVECGVWRGGSSMLMAEALLSEGSDSRSLYLYDTYAGMSEPTDKDVNLHGTSSIAKWQRLQKGAINEWDYASREEVEKNLSATGYPESRLHFVEGKVEETIPATMPERIALLRLDTDWHDSTKHTLEHLFPRLSKGGVLVIDDYGHWQGARQAVDEYFKANGICMLLNRIDYTGRIGVKAV